MILILLWGYYKWKIYNTVLFSNQYAEITDDFFINYVFSTSSLDCMLWMNELINDDLNIYILWAGRTEQTWSVTHHSHLFILVLNFNCKRLIHVSNLNIYLTDFHNNLENTLQKYRLARSTKGEQNYYIIQNHNM